MALRAQALDLADRRPVTLAALFFAGGVTALLIAVPPIAEEALQERQPSGSAQVEHP